MIGKMTELVQNPAHSPGLSGLFDNLYQIAEILTAIPDRTRFLEVMLQTARRCFLANQAAILSYHQRTKRWFLEASVGLDETAIEDLKGMSWTVIERTSVDRSGLLINDARTHEITRDRPSICAYNILSVLTAPIFDNRGLWGVLYLANTSIPRAFDADSQKQVAKFTSFAGIAIQRCEDLVRLSSPLRPPSDDSAEPSPGLFEFKNPKMREVMASLQQAANTDIPVLLGGETGTGKDFLARWIHDHSPRRKGPFEHINCAAITMTLQESELFGIESGVATGVSFHEGKLKIADSGTVFLNEIGELPLSTQSKLLRVLNERILDRVGGKTPVGVDTRFVCATNSNLESMVVQGAFRQDLFYRINLLSITIPPLRERPEDLPVLVNHLLKVICHRHRRALPRVSEQTMRRLASHAWPGNIRELGNLLERSILLSTGDELCLVEGPPEPDVAVPYPFRRGERFRLPEALREIERQIILDVMRETGWKVRLAATRLGIPENTLRTKMSKLGISSPPHRP
ncbi:MAG TPA: sigma-54-dependent Fis family transcriptional regulator [Acidobacteriota bacterium]|nr:sigma-54-dependent Fis family transcriptional regulator [Acidobacteriota bacterium]